MIRSDWASELEFVDVLEQRITERPTTREGIRLRVFREFDAGFGRVDLLCVRYDDTRLNARRDACPRGDLKPFKLLDGYAMTFLGR